MSEEIIPLKNEENLPVIEKNSEVNGAFEVERNSKEAIKNVIVSEIDISPKKVRGRPFPKGVVQNPNGRPRGSKNYNTLFDSALKAIAKKNKIPLKDAETQLIAKGLISAFAGDYNFYRDALDRRFGKARESIDISGGQLPIILEVVRGRDRLPEPEQGPENNTENNP